MTDKRKPPGIAGLFSACRFCGAETEPHDPGPDGGTIATCPACRAAVTATIDPDTGELRATWTAPKARDTSCLDFDYIVDLAPAAEQSGEEITLKLRPGDHSGRYCCECHNYKWARGCPYRSGHIALKAEACGMFNVVIRSDYTED